MDRDRSVPPRHDIRWVKAIMVLAVSVWVVYEVKVRCAQESSRRRGARIDVGSRTAWHPSEGRPTMTKTKAEHQKLSSADWILIAFGSLGALTLVVGFTYAMVVVVPGEDRDRDASIAVDEVTAAQAQARDTLGIYLDAGDLEDQGFLTADYAGSATDLKVLAGNDGECFVVTAPLTRDRTLYATSRLPRQITSAKPNLAWCGEDR